MLGNNRSYGCNISSKYLDGGTRRGGIPSVSWSKQRESTEARVRKWCRHFCVPGCPSCNLVYSVSRLSVVGGPEQWHLRTSSTRLASSSPWAKRRGISSTTR